MEFKYIATPALLRRALHRAKYLNRSKKSDPPPPASTSPGEETPPSSRREGARAERP
jgi:hypothetical protein